MRPSATKYDALRAELVLVDSRKLEGGVGVGGGGGEEGGVAEIVEAALTPDGPFALYELSSRGPTLRELFEGLFNALNLERPDYPEH
jgi:hypothetical protein